MAANYATLFGTLGAELQNQRKVEAVFEHFHFQDNANYSKRLLSAIYATGGGGDVYQEVANTSESTVYEKTIASQASGQFQTLKGSFETAWFPLLDSQIFTSAADKAVGGISYVYDPTLTDGTVSILSRTGRWGALRAQMIADGQVILQNVITFGSINPLGQNYGQLVLASVSGMDHALTGTLTLLCTDDTVGAQKFTITNTLTRKSADPTIPTSQDGLTSILSALSPMTLGKSWCDGQLGIAQMLINPAAATATDPSNIFQSPNNPFSSEADTNKGLIYIKLTRQASSPIWLIQWFKDAAYTQLVTQTTADGTVGTFALSMTGSGTLYQATFSLANANTAMPSTGNTYSYVYNPNFPRLNDQWTLTMTNNEQGNFATKIAHRYPASLNSAAAAPVSALTAGAPSAGGSVTNGTHSYVYTYIINGIETPAAGTSNVITAGSGNNTVGLSGITVGPAGTTARKVYRTIAGNTGNYLLLTTIADNVTTTFSDTLADGSLGTSKPPVQISDTLAASISMV